MPKYTVFCQQTDNLGSTIWISSVEALSPARAMEQGLHECARDWECDADDITVLGIAAGDVEIIAWHDSGYSLDEITEQGFTI